MTDTPTKTPEEIIGDATKDDLYWSPTSVVKALDAAGYAIVPKDVLAPFLAFASANRGLQLLSDVQMTNGSPMAGPQVYGRDFLALAAAQNEESPPPVK